ncbi:MAG: alpha-glucuronidase [Verrucomicrobiae bacterium]|nr:alpha-glucuronidase [Verrucomicrobiae bacterium]
MNGISRREFVWRSVAGTAGLWLAGNRWVHSGERSGAVAPVRPTDEDGYMLWLRYAPPAKQAVREYQRRIKRVCVAGGSPTCRVISEEIATALKSLLGDAVPVSNDGFDAGTLLIGTPATSAQVRENVPAEDLDRLGPEGYIIRSVKLKGGGGIIIASSTDIGALYGCFHFLRLLQTGQPIAALEIKERPRLKLRLMNHWDNLDGSVERGYAGRSLWRWAELPDKLGQRYVDYARACASLGLNGAVIHNVNANPRILTAEYLRKVAALANVWRPYGVRMYLTANFAAPVRIGGLPTADPLDQRVKDWWRAKADEIYSLIPDFGGFLVKADSEGQPGPKTYGRSHAEGANLLAEALAPHGGVVMWRAFVYDHDVDPDRVKRAYIEFTRLDGQFRANVVIQIKNGPLDFQPREPFHPLFGALKHTPVMAEIQPTQEYLGQAKHLVYLGPMWEEFLQSDTYAKGQGSTVAKVLMGEVHPYQLTGMAGVVNPGADANWCGHHFSQANWYAFGRLAWNPELGAAQLAEEWTRMTFTNDPEAVRTICRMMMTSYETFVSYTMPLGLHHLIGGDHYAPMPWNDRAPREDWTATYYHRASEDGIGFDRTRRGSGAVDQYHPPLCDIFDDINRCPEKFLLWFHRCAWDHRMKSGRTLWEELCAKYDEGVRQARELQKTWETLKGKIDARRHREVAERLAIQVADAAKWRDQILEYFARFSKRPVPKPVP